MKRWLAWALITFALHFIWEMGQARWYASMQGLPFWTATLICLRAAAADVGITAAVYVATALSFRDVRWFRSRNWRIAAAIFVLLGLAITVAIEFWAISRGRWTYALEMPMIGGQVGLLPLLQWTTIPAVLVTLARLDARPSTGTERV